MTVRFAGPSTSRGLAILCGWGGGTLKNVHKHAPLWSRLGWRTATVEMSMDMTFFPSKWTAVPEITEMVATAVYEHRSRRSDSLVVSHAFSNGGTFMQLALQEAGVQFDASVYDSAPSSGWLPLPAGAPMVLAVSGLAGSQLVKSAIAHVPYSLVATMAFPFVELPPPLGLFPKLFKSETNTPRPELFVYGERDRVIPPAHVEAFAQLRRDQGADVHMLGPLPGSSHCGHLRVHHDAYEQAIEAFGKVVELQSDSAQ